MIALKKDENFICKLLNETIEENSKEMGYLSSVSVNADVGAEVLNLDEYFENRSKVKKIEKIDLDSDSSDHELLFFEKISVKVYKGKYLESIKCYRLSIDSKQLDFPYNLFFFKELKGRDKIYLEFDEQSDPCDLIKILNSISNTKFNMLFIFFHSNSAFYFICGQSEEIATKEQILSFIKNQNYQCLEFKKSL
ncbi:MAG: hypothetical protein HQK51_07315 [Oligoflexia bacterium]|nr:hypothetical protein [Oligoflexia bacterium]